MGWQLATQTEAYATAPSNGERRFQKRGKGRTEDTEGTEGFLDGSGGSRHRPGAHATAPSNGER
jgi:hypothetical protein